MGKCPRGELGKDHDPGQAEGPLREAVNHTKMQIRRRLSIKAMIRYAAGCFMAFLFSLMACTKNPSPAKVTITPLQTRINSDSNLSFYHRLIIQANETG